jgi:hypothetical protein
VWQAFGVPMSWRKRQGLIVGKRCGTTENIGPAARQRWSNGLQRVRHRRQCKRWCKQLHTSQVANCDKMV